MPSNDWQKIFLADHGLTLTPLELAAVAAAEVNMSRTDVSLRDYIDDYSNSAFGKLEAESKTPSGDGDACCLDPDAFQIMRYHDQSTMGQQWVRFGLQRIKPDANDFEAFMRPNMFQFPVGHTAVDLGTDAADVARRLNVLWAKGQRVVAFLGKARMDITKGMELIEPIQKLVANVPDVAYMTGGYRGEAGNNYGVTRAGFDVPKAKNLETLVIMCSAGIKDANQTANAMSVYGRQWGDDTPGLSTACDGAVFFRNIPKGKIYGWWTYVEIANFVYRDKPLAILDPEAAVSVETHFGAQVPVFKNAESVAAFLRQSLPTAEKMRSQQPLKVEETAMLPVLQHEKYMGVRLYFDGDEYARWVRLDAEGHKPFTGAGLKFSSSPDAFEGERDLVLDGYWKDIMLLQHFHKLQETKETGDLALKEIADLARAYADCRKKLEQLRTTQDNLSWWWDQRKPIDGIWFLWPGEHDARVVAMLQALPTVLPKSEYDKKVAR